MPGTNDASDRVRLGATVQPGGGVLFAAWAPERRNVAVVWANEDGGGGETELTRDDQGVWRGTVDAAGVGTLYAFRLDAEGPFPDPYARDLPEGVHGRGRVIDPSTFEWHDGAWGGLRREGLIVYELHVGTFTPEGTFDAAIGRLDYLVELGVNALEIMPVSSFPGERNWGYDGVGHYAPEASYGGPDGLRRLVDAAHGRGLGVLIDAVYNHMGPSGNYLRAYSSGYFTDRYHTPWGDALNYDGPDSTWVREWAIGNAIEWVVEYHADGLRLDATAEIHDASDEHLLTELSRRTRAAAGRPIVLIAEDNRNDVRLVGDPRRGGHGLDAIWADDFHHAVRTLVREEREGYFANYTGRIGDIASAIKGGFLYRGQIAPRTGKPRGKPTGRVPASAFVYCTENHDQVGNRAFGERLCHLVSPGVYRAASALLLLVPETPMLFMGQEFAATTPFLYFTDHDPELGRLVTEGRRKEFKDFAAFKDGASTEQVPDPQAVETFERSKLSWADAERNGPVLALYQALIALRTTDPVLRGADRRDVRTSPLGRQGLALSIETDEGRRLALVNFGPARDVVVSPRLDVGGDWRVLLTTEAREYGGGGGAVALIGGQAHLPAESATLLAPEK